jgi:predicted transcriptional regulator
MADDSSPPKVDPGLVAEIVSSYVGKNPIGIDQIGSLMATVHRTLSGLGQAAPASLPEAVTPAVPIRRSVQPDYVVCLECGVRSQTLRRHLRVQHGLEVAAYRARWKLPPDHPLTAPAYSARRSAMAKQIGFGRGRQEADIIPPESAGAPPAAPTRRGRPRRRPAS